MHICFVALNSYNLFTSSKSLTHIGGAEMQQFLMARWLVDEGHKVTVVTLDHGQEQEEHVNGIRIVKSYDVKRGLPIVRFFNPRWSKLVKALRIADADIYFQMCAGVETGQVGLWCRKNSKPFVYASASDADCDSSFPFLTKRRDKILYEKGLRLASAVVAQSKQQKALLKASFGLPSEVVNGSGRILGDPVSPTEKRNSVIWLGRLSPQKRFDWVLDVAAACGDYEFLILGSSNDESEYAQEMQRRAESLANVKLVGHVPASNVIEYYNQARFLILTSPIEGFPNVFLEAWQLGIPVITSFDPDGVVEDNRLGWTIGSPKDAISILDDYSSSDAELEEIADHVMGYFNENYTVETNMPVFMDLFRRLVDRN